MVINITTVLKEPQLIVQMEKDIQVNIQNCSLSIYNSIISDLGPFFESPIPPATDGPSIKLRIVFICYESYRVIPRSI